MAEKTDWTLIARYLSENASPQDKHSVLDWTLTDPQNQARLDEATKVWKHAGVKIPPPIVETEMEWAELLRRIDDEPPPPNRSKRLILAVVVIVGALSIGAATGYFILRDDQPQSSGKFTYMATRDSVKRFFLPDSTVVWLNESTRLQFAKPYDRKVQLEGEAFFEVREKAEPFQVNARGIVAKATGASFNLNARSAVPVTITVVEGKIELTGVSSAGKEKLTLLVGDQGTYNPKDGTLSKRTNIDKSFLDWRKHNNSIYKSESASPRLYLDNQYVVRPNGTDQTVIEGRLRNIALIATYSAIKVKIVLSGPKGRRSESFLHIPTGVMLSPRQYIDYHTTMAAPFTGKTTVYFVVDHVEVN